jgi:hypothetical protein
MLAGRNLGLVVGVFTMGGKRQKKWKNIFFSANEQTQKLLNVQWRTKKFVQQLSLSASSFLYHLIDT